MTNLLAIVTVFLALVADPCCARTARAGSTKSLFRRRRASSRAGGIRVSSGFITTPVTPPALRDQGRRPDRPPVSARAFPTSTGKTSRSTTRDISTSATSATTRARCRPGDLSHRRARPRMPADEPLAASAMTFYALPTENRFDAEGLFVDRGPRSWWRSIVMVVKPSFSLSRSSRLSPLLRPARPRSIGRLHEFTEPATGADLSGDQTLLAVCSSAVTRVYRRDDVNSPAWRLLAEVRYAALPIEGIAWDGTT